MFNQRGANKQLHKIPTDRSIWGQHYCGKQLMLVCFPILVWFSTFFYNFSTPKIPSHPIQHLGNLIFHKFKITHWSQQNYRLSPNQVRGFNFRPIYWIAQVGGAQPWFDLGSTPIWAPWQIKNDSLENLWMLDCELRIGSKKI